MEARGPLAPARLQPLAPQPLDCQLKDLQYHLAALVTVHLDCQLLVTASLRSPAMSLVATIAMTYYACQAQNFQSLSS